MSKNLIPLDPVDVFSIQPRAEELITEEVIGYLQSINIDTSLLSDDDPLKEEYVKFLSDMGNTPILITNEDIGAEDSRSYFDDVDFSNTANTPEAVGLQITKDQMLSNKMWLNGHFHSSIFPICQTYVTPFQLNTIPFVSGKVMGKTMECTPVQFGYEPPALACLNTLRVTK